ncbi:WD40/YVTN/BNR-like repeat-containing protein [Burkholderia vietnamiensis]|uniref:WD40/YVTN/BNR-like repeat-containing protein n=1 Tax=Burkholderia vietnamiensis TaxID=60552 RepID=UPI000A8FE885|nr:YCF48-related protein [Burkholderia vietnamiensis]
MNMLKAKRWKVLIGGLIVLTVTSYGYWMMTIPRWATVTTGFTKNDKPYGGGSFRVRGNELMTLKIAGPEIRFHVVGLDKGYDAAQAVPEEPWMNNVDERLNRKSVSLLRGNSDGGLSRYFQQSAQGAAWWYSKDWDTLYVATDWMDYKLPEPENGLSPHIAKLWRSADGGKTWAQLEWPEDQNIYDLRFLDSQRGYAIGWGPHVWRTADGGQTWQEIALPPMATDSREPRKAFNAADLGPDGVLRVAYYVPMLGRIQLSSVVYRLNWDATQFEQDVVLPDQVVVQLGSTDVPSGHTYSVYALSQLGAPRNYQDLNDKGHRTGALSTWASYAQPNVEQLHTFDPHYKLDGLSVGKKGVLLVYATDASREGAPHDITFYSRDFGKSWNDLDDGTGQGGWFDAQSNIQYALYAYTLKKRQF